MKLFNFEAFYIAVKESVLNFGDASIPKMSASLSYYTIFAIAPILYLLVTFLSIFFGDEAIQGEVYGYLDGYMGNDTAMQIQELLQNTTKERMNNDNFWTTALSVVTLVLTASGVFAEIQDSINRIWHLKAKPSSWLDFVKNRILSFSMIITIGFIMLSTLLINAFLDVLNERLAVIFSDFTVYLTLVINNVIVLAIVSVLFYTVFKVLPDGKVATRPAIVGAIMTTFLFLIGKAGISYYLGTNDVGSVFGAGGTLILILLWVNYSSILLFFGALFTRNYASAIDQPIQPKSDTVFIIETQSERNPELNKESVTDEKN